jgi:serine protease Do
MSSSTLRTLVPLVLSLAMASSALGQTRSPQFQSAAQAWSELDRFQRVRVQVLLAATGHWNAVPNQDFGQRLFDAITRFQRDSGFEPTGYLTDEQVNRLFRVANPVLAMWGLREIKHPTRNVTLWVPMGLGLSSSRM